MLEKLKNVLLEGYVKKLVPYELESMSESYDSFNRFWRWNLWLAATLLVGILICGYLISNYFLNFVDNFFVSMMVALLFFHFGVFPFYAKKLKDFTWILRFQLILLTSLAVVRLFQFGHINEPIAYSYLIVPILAFCLGEYILGLVSTIVIVIVMGIVIFGGHPADTIHLASLPLRSRSINYVWSYFLIFVLLMAIRIKRHIITSKLKQLIFKLMTERKFLQIFEIQKGHQAVITSLNHELTNPITVLLYTLTQVKEPYKEMAKSVSRHLDTISLIIKKYTEKENENMQNKFHELEKKFSRNHNHYIRVVKSFNDDFYPLDQYTIAFCGLLFFVFLLSFFNSVYYLNYAFAFGFLIPVIALCVNNYVFKISYLSPIVFGFGVLSSLFILCMNTGGMYSHFLILLLSFVFLFILIERIKVMLLFYFLTNILIYILFINSTEYSAAEIEATNVSMFFTYSFYIITFSVLTVWRDKKSEKFYESVFDFKKTIEVEADETLKAEKLINFMSIQAELYDSLKYHFDEVEKFVKQYGEFYSENEIAKIQKSLHRMDQVLAQVEMLIVSGPEYKQYAKDIEMMSIAVKKNENKDQD